VSSNTIKGQTTLPKLIRTDSNLIILSRIFRFSMDTYVQYCSVVYTTNILGLDNILEVKT